MKGATVDSEQSRPASDEAFAKCFHDLVDHGRRDRKFKRLVVFVDELDRCSPEDVVTTLTAIRTFLNQDHAVFIVAADRAALERALDDKLPQATPVDEESPYYSSASSFFDKVFHDRVPLPPLRGPRLYEWAFEKVSARGGYWSELRDGEDTRTLRRVLFFLIPSHVRAPRRVKVLLNSFIRSAAIAAHSDFEWRERAQEIAKLTVLDVEFPALGADLRLEPRLPELLLNPPKQPSERVERLLRKHGGLQISRARGRGGPASEEEEGAEPSDAIIAAVTDEQAEALTRAEHEQLRRYLARTRGVKIGRDLLFLDRAGAAVGLEDVELAELLDEAVDAPQDVVEALEKRGTETKLLAAKVLADMVEREFGEERANSMSALMGVVEQLGELDEIADEIAGSVQAYEREEPLEAEHLPGALAVALAARGYSYLEDQILADPRLMADEKAVVKVATQLPRIRAANREPIYEGVARTIDNDSEVLIEILEELPDEERAKLLEAEPVYGAVVEFLVVSTEPPGGHDHLIEDIFEIAEREGEGEGEGEGNELLRAAHELLLMEKIVYGQLKAHSPGALAALDIEDRDMDILRTLQSFGYRDSEHWLQQLSTPGYSSAEHGKLAAEIVIKRLNLADFDDPSQPEEGIAAIDSLLAFLKMCDEETALELRNALGTMLAGRDWWIDESGRAHQEAFHKIAHALMDVSEFLAEEIGSLLAEDLRRAPLQADALNEHTLSGLATMGAEVGKRAEIVLLALAEAEDEGNPLPVWTTRARVSLAAAARRAGGQADSKAVSKAAIWEAADQDSAHGNAAVADWLRLGPDVEAVAKVLEHLEGRRTPAIDQGAEAWREEATKAERTELAKQMLRPQGWRERWLGQLVAVGLDESDLLEHIAAQVQGEKNGERRGELMETLARIRPVDPGAQRALADLIIELVEKGKRVDFDAAVRAIPGLGTEHHSATRLRKTFQDAAEEHGFQLSERAATQLVEAGVRVSKKSVKKGVWGQVRDLFR